MTAETMKMFREIYEERKEIKEKMNKAVDENDETAYEEAVRRNDELRSRIGDPESDMDRLYYMYADAWDIGETQIIIDEYLTEDAREELVNLFIEDRNVLSFAYSCTTGNCVEDMWAFTQAGYHIVKMLELKNGRPAFLLQLMS